VDLHRGLAHRDGGVSGHQLGRGTEAVIVVLGLDCHRGPKHEASRRLELRVHTSQPGPHIAVVSEQAPALTPLPAVLQGHLVRRPRCAERRGRCLDRALAQDLPCAGEPPVPGPEQPPWLEHDLVEAEHCVVDGPLRDLVVDPLDGEARQPPVDQEGARAAFRWLCGVGAGEDHGEASVSAVGNEALGAVENP
jgi:hypothetical protein